MTHHLKPWSTPAWLTVVAASGVRGRACIWGDAPPATYQNRSDTVDALTSVEVTTFPDHRTATDQLPTLQTHAPHEPSPWCSTLVPTWQKRCVELSSLEARSRALSRLKRTSFTTSIFFTKTGGDYCEVRWTKPSDQHGLQGQNYEIVPSSALVSAIPIRSPGSAGGAGGMAGAAPEERLSGHSPQATAKLP